MLIRSEEPEARMSSAVSGKHASCLVNPRAGHETSLKILPVVQGREQTLAVVGAGPAGDSSTFRDSDPSWHLLYLCIP